MQNFEKLLQDVKTIAKNITKEEFEQSLEEYEKIQSKRSESMEGFKITQPQKAKSRLKIGKERSIIIESDNKFNKLQKKIWKFLLNIDIEDVEE